MEANRARQSIDDAPAGDEPSLGNDSRVNLPTHAAEPAGVDEIRSSPAVISTATPANLDVQGGEKSGDVGKDASGIDQPQDATNAQKKPPLWKRRWFIITNTVLSLLGIALLFIILYPVIHAIAQHVVNVSVLNLDQASIQQPSNTSFELALQGVVTHTGIFSAVIWFTQPIDVTWLDGENEVPLGSMTLGPLSSKHKRAYINQTTTFQISDEDAFGRFAATMITQENFTWRLESPELRVRALAFPTAHGIKFSKELTLNGINNFDGNVALKDLALPSDSPQGGINFAATTELNNPSPFELGLGTIVFDLQYQDVYMGTGTGYNTSLCRGSNDIVLSGVLIPHNDSSELAVVSRLFTNYINGVSSPVIAVGKSTLQSSDNSSISWLSKGLESLSLNVPFKSLSGPIAPIKAINIGEFGLAFTPETAWSPVANSDSVQASLELPFGFEISIGEIQNSFNITKNGSVVAGLSTPLGASTSSISVINDTFTHGTINISIADSNMGCPDPSHPHFSRFNADLTDLDLSEFLLVGYSSAVANLSIGQITLDPINFNVSSSLNGLQGLQGSTIIEAVDVVGGTTDGITLGINVSIYNPSNLNLNTGDLTLELYRGDGLLGTTLLPNLTLNMGNNSLAAQGTFEANNSPEGLETLNDFVGQKDVQLKIAGYSGSTQIDSLLQAFETINIGATLPGLRTSLLDMASMEVLNSTGRDNNITHVTVDMVNPFTAELDITEISSSITSYGLNLGTIDTSTSFKSPGKKTTTSPSLDLNLNLDPSTIFTLTRALAVDAGLSTEQLDGIVQLGGYSYMSTDPESNSSTVTRRDNIYTGFNLPNFVDTAFQQLHSDVDLTAEVTIGEYQTSLKYSETAVPTKTDDSLNLLLPILAQPIVQKIVTGSVLGIESVLITNPQEDSFGTKLKGSITNAGPFDAKISFTSGLTISWSDKPLGTIILPNLQVVGDMGADIDVDATFEVADVDHLTDFTKVLLTEESFDWDISGDDLTVSALGIDVPGIRLSTKKVTLKGFNGLKDGVKINTFDLPSNDPSGGIHLTVNSSVSNPSQIGIELDFIGFQAYFGNTNLGPVSANSSFSLSPQSMVQLALEGRLIPQDSDSGLEDISTVFNNFIHGKDSSITIHGQSAGPSSVKWLNDGIQSLQVDTSLPNQGVLDLIKSVTLYQMELLFTPDTAFDPSAGSNSTDAAFQLPFNFPVDITVLEQNITVSYEGQSFAELAIPKRPSTTDVERRIIHLTFQDIPFTVFDNGHDVFDKFVASTTMSENQTMHLSGVANTDAKTAVGTLSLTNIDFSVDTSLAGLQGLDAKPTLVESLDVNHGYQDYLLIQTTVSMFNPSNLTIGTGDVQFDLQFMDQTIGMADVSNLVIVPGNSTYSIAVHYSPQGNAVSAGQQLLENYLQGVDSSTSIAGSADSTPIESLKLALSEIHLSPVTIPALNQTLITGTSLSFPTDIVRSGVASASFSLAIPFTASINLLEVTATATYQNLTLGLIDHVDESASPIHADGHSNITSPTLPFRFNLDPTVIIQLLLGRAKEKNVDLGPLFSLFRIVLDNPNNNLPINTTVDTGSPKCVSGKQFDVNDAILNALQGLRVDLNVESSVKIDDYATDLTFNQTSVPTDTDHTALYLIGAVAPPITQKLVDDAKLTFSEANITNISDEGFDLSLLGSLTDIGPLDALITFVEPVVVTWNGRDIATIDLPPVCGAADSGVPDYQTNAHLTITDHSEFTSFATYLLHNPSFDWTISTSKLRVEALGTIFDNVALSKNISFKAFNNLPGVTISNFDLPGDDSAGGIHIETDSTIPSPSQLGIGLGTVGFQAYFEDTLVGPLWASGLFLAPNSDTTAHLSGRIVPQSGSDLDTIGTLFSEFLSGDNQTLSVHGESIQPSNSSGSVIWLSDAFRTLALNVTLPGNKYTIIQSISMSDLEVVMTQDDQAWSPLASSNFTLAEYKNPFGFSLQVVKSAENITLSSGGSDIAQLQLPHADTVGGVSTGNVADLDINFHNEALRAIDHGAFSALFAEVTDEDSASFTLQGTADVVARTTIGDVPISGIPFNVQSSLIGINAFGGTASLSNLSITGSGRDGGDQYIKAPLTTTLHNPSNVSLQTVDIALPVYYQGLMLGRAAIDSFNLVPGDNVVSTEFHYMPEDANDTAAQAFLTGVLQTGDPFPLTIRGDSGSSPFGSLQPALEGLELSTSLKGLDVPPIISHINAYISISTLFDNKIEIDFDVSNPLDAPLYIEFVQDDSGVNNETYAHFDQAFDNFVVPAGQTANSGKFGNVVLTKGALASLPIIPLRKLDVFSATTVRVGEGGYQIPWLLLTVYDVTVDYHLPLGLDDMLSMASSIVRSSTAASSQTGSIGASITGGGGSWSFSNPLSSMFSSALPTGSSSDGHSSASTTQGPTQSSSEPTGGDDNPSQTSSTQDSWPTLSWSNPIQRQ